MILASASPRRHNLLTQIAVPHRVEPAHIDETLMPGEAPEDYVQRLALAKARTLYIQHPGETILAADTTVVLQGEVLNKPPDRAAAEATLRALAGRTHLVHTAIAVVSDRGEQVHLETTAVRMSAIPEAELQLYLNTGDSLDKAGAYGIQGFAARWIERIDGDYFNVVGLPLAATARLLRAAEEVRSTARK